MPAPSLSSYPGTHTNPESRSITQRSSKSANKSRDKPTCALLYDIIEDIPCVMEMHVLYKTLFERARNILAGIGAGSVLCAMGIMLFAIVIHIRKD